MGPNVAINYLKNLFLKDLSEKLVISLGLLSAQIVQTIKPFSIKHIILEKVKCTFCIKTAM